MTGIWSESRPSPPGSSFTVQTAAEESRNVVPFTLNPYSLNPLAPPPKQPPSDLRLKRTKQLLTQYPFAPPFNGPPTTLTSSAAAAAPHPAAKRVSKPPSIPPRTSLIPSWHPASSPLAPPTQRNNSTVENAVSLPDNHNPHKRLPEQITALLDRAIPTIFEDHSPNATSSLTSGIPFIFHLAHLLSSIECEDSRLGRDRMVSGMSVAHELAAVLTRRQTSYYTLVPVEVQIRRSYLVYETMAMALLSQHVGLANCRPVSCTATFISHLPVKLWPTVPRLGPNGPLITGDAALNRVANFIDAHRTSFICHLLNALHEKHEYKPHTPHLVKMIEMLAMVGPELSTMNLMAFLVASRTFFRLLYRLTDSSSADVLLSLLGADPPLTPAISGMLVDALERQYFPPEQQRRTSSSWGSLAPAGGDAPAPSRSSLPPRHSTSPQTLLNFYAAVALRLRQAVDAVLKRKPVKPKCRLLWSGRRVKSLQADTYVEVELVEDEDQDHQCQSKRVDTAPPVAVPKPPPPPSSRRQEWQSWSGDESSSAVSIEEPLSPGMWVRGDSRSKRRRIASEEPLAAAAAADSSTSLNNNNSLKLLRRAFSEEPPRWRSDEWLSSRGGKSRRCYSLSRLSSSPSTSPSWGKTGLSSVPAVTTSPPTIRRFRVGGSIRFLVDDQERRFVVKRKRHLAGLDRKEENELLAITDFLRRLLDGSLLVLASQPQIFINTAAPNPSPSSSAAAQQQQQQHLDNQPLERHPQAMLVQRIFLTAGVCEDLGRILFLPVKTCHPHGHSRRRGVQRGRGGGRHKRSSPLHKLSRLCSKISPPPLSLSTTRCALLTLANLAAAATKTPFGPLMGFSFQLLGRLQITAPAAIIFIHRAVSHSQLRWAHLGCFPSTKTSTKILPAAVVEALTAALQALLAVAARVDTILPQDTLYWTSLAKLFLLASLSDIARLRASKVLTALLARSALGHTAETLLAYTPFLQIFTSTLRYCLENRQTAQAERFLGPLLDFGCALDDCVQVQDNSLWKAKIRDDPQWRSIERHISLYRVGRAKGPPDLSLMIPLEQTRKLRDQRKSEEKCQRQRRTPAHVVTGYIPISAPGV